MVPLQTQETHTRLGLTLHDLSRFKPKRFKSTHEAIKIKIDFVNTQIGLVSTQITEPNHLC